MGDFFIWVCSVKGWGYIGEEIFEKENLIKKLGEKKLFLDAEGRSQQAFPWEPGGLWGIFLYGFVQ